MIEADKNMTRCESCGTWMYMDNFMHVKKLLGEILICKTCSGGKK